MPVGVRVPIVSHAGFEKHLILNLQDNVMDHSTAFHFHDLEDRTYLLTGAANGIGRELAIGLAGQGARLVLVDVDVEGLRRTGELIRRSVSLEEDGISLVECNLADVKARDDLIHEVGKLHTSIDGLIHNAAIDPRCPLETTGLDLFRHVMATNVEPALEISRDLLPRLKESPCGRIILIGSVTLDIGTLS